jgi:hypothetical protein
MKNVAFAVKGNVLTITVDLTKTFGPSSSGKTTIVASTSGAAKVAGPKGDVSVGLNVFTKG